MVQQAYPTLNGQAQSWVDLNGGIVIHDGPTLDLDDIKALKWDVSVEVGTQRRRDGTVKAYTAGQGTANGSIEFYADGAIRFVEKLIDVALAKGWTRNGAGIYGRVGFNIITLHTPLGATGMRKVEIMGCRLKKDIAEASEGVDPDSNALDLIVTYVQRTINGKKGVLA